MQEIDGKWTIFGCEADDPKCLHTVDEAIAYIHKVGFLPFFSCDIPGVSLEERTVSTDWWGDDESKDPWVWREVIARAGDIAYGKFFYNRAGFITKQLINNNNNDDENAGNTYESSADSYDANLIEFREEQ